MNGEGGANRDANREAERLEGEMAQVCGVINAATGALVALVAQLLETGAYQGAGIRSAEQWLAWKCGLSSGRAQKVVAMARRLAHLPELRAALEAGEVSEDQVAVACRHAPAHADAEVATLARAATVAQLARTLRRYRFAEDDTEAEEQPRRLGFGHTEEGGWRLSALLPPDEGAVVEVALSASRAWLADQGVADEPSWADALVAMAERSLVAPGAPRAHRERPVVVVHLQAEKDGAAAHLHLGPALPDPLRRLLGCDGRVRGQHDAGAVPLSVGRARRIVPERTRVAVEERDGACRVPGCERTRWLQVHHVVHWEDGGRTDTANLVALCGPHHRLHHRGGLGIAGNADEPEAMVFTDPRGRRLTGGGPTGAAGPASDHRHLGSSQRRATRPPLGALQRGPGPHLRTAAGSSETLWPAAKPPPISARGPSPGERRRTTPATTTPAAPAAGPARWRPDPRRCPPWTSS